MTFLYGHSHRMETTQSSRDTVFYRKPLECSNRVSHQPKPWNHCGTKSGLLMFQTKWRQWYGERAKTLCPQKQICFDARLQLMDAVRYANREMKILCMHSTAVPLYNPSEISYQRGIKALSNKAHASLTLLVLFLQVQQIRRSLLWCYGICGTNETTTD